MDIHCIKNEMDKIYLFIKKKKKQIKTKIYNNYKWLMMVKSIRKKI